MDNPGHKRTIGGVRSLPWILLACVLLATPARAQGSDYARDVDFALEELGKRCGALLQLKGVDWRKVSAEFRKEAKKVESDEQHLLLLVRLLARLRDGHCEVRPLPKGAHVKLETPATTGPGLFLCRSGKKILIKNAWGDAAELGISAGMELAKIDDQPVSKWLEARMAVLADTRSFSSDQQAFFHACHWGLAAPVGTRLDLELLDLEGKRRKRTLTYAKASIVPWGPAFFPPGFEGEKDVGACVLPSGYGYIHVRRCPSELPELIDRALASLGDVPGLVLDFRANGGGGFDHEAFMGRFVPAGAKLHGSVTYASAGPRPYGGPIVVIVDGNVRSAGETGSGIFKEDGRAYMIGESATAGMASQKETLELPSGLFALYVSVASNKAGFNGGRGIEGIGVVPHELCEYAPADLAAGVDTLTRRAEALLADFPSKSVPYDPAAHGWKPPQR